jgi:hypothetical protein
MLLKTLLLLLTAVWLRPSLVLNEKTLRWAADRLRNRGWDVTWQSLHVEARSVSLWVKRVGIRARGLCVRGGGVDACADGLEAGGEVGLRGFRPELRAIDPVNLQGGRFSAGGVSGTADLARGILRADARVDRLRIAARGPFRPAPVARRLDADLRLSVAGIDDRVSARSCRITTRERDAAGELALDCAFVARVRLPSSSKLPTLRPPDSVSGRIRAELRTSAWIPDPAERVHGTVAVVLDPLRSRAAEVEGRAETRARVDGVPTDDPSLWKIEGEAAASLEARRFEVFVAALDPTPWAVPAPFNALQGVIRLDLRTLIRGFSIEGPLQLRTRLVSAGQLLDVDATSLVRVGEGTRVVVDVVLTDVQLALPKLELAAPPRIFPDSRIARRQEAGELGVGEPPRYRIRVRTPRGRPLRLLSNFAREPVPVRLSVALDDGREARGTAEVLRFPLRAFRRDAELESFRVDLKTRQIAGSIKVRYTDYTVTIAIAGTLDRTEVRLSSEPPVPEQQLIAVLLFGREIDELDPDQTASVGSTRAAIADGALNLASLYALAATPVESVGYDPRNGVFSAKVRLGLGTSLNVGAGAGELEYVGIRRRLSRFWTLTTDLAHPTGREDRAVSAFLEWIHRY